MYPSISGLPCRTLRLHPGDMNYNTAYVETYLHAVVHGGMAAAHHSCIPVYCQAQSCRRASCASDVADIGHAFEDSAMCATGG